MLERGAPATLAVLVFFARPASAQQTADKLRITWNAPPSCASGSQVIEDVGRRLGGATPRHTLEATVDVETSTDGAWTAKIVTNVDGAPGERSLQAASCDSLERATTLVLALAVDPERALARESPPPPPPPPPPPKPAPRAEPESSALHVVASVSAVGDTATLPKPAIGGEASAGILYGRLRVEAAFEDSLLQHANATPSEGTAIHVFGGSLRGCYRAELTAAWDLDPCATAGLVFATSEGFGESVPFDRSSSWGRVGAELFTTYRIAGPLALRGGIGIAAPLARPPFVLVEPSGNVPLHRAAVVTGTASFGLEARFP